MGEAQARTDGVDKLAAGHRWAVGHVVGLAHRLGPAGGGQHGVHQVLDVDEA